MSFLSKLMDTMKLTDTEDEDYFDGDEEYEDTRDSKTSRKGRFSNREEEDDFDDSEDTKPRFFPRSAKVVPMRRQMEVALVKPTTIEDAREVCDYMLSGKAVVLNMEGIHTELAQRIIDFTSGATYSMDGNLQKISNYIFIATPSSVELCGDFQDLVTNGNLEVSGLNIRL